MTGNATYGQVAVTALMNWTISADELSGGSQVNTYRWGDWVPVVFDWCYNLMTPSQVSTFIARYNNYTTTMTREKLGRARHGRKQLLLGLLAE